MGAEAIQSAVHVVLPSLQLTCDMVHCLGERPHFSSLFAAIFWRFLSSNTPIMLKRYLLLIFSFLKVIDEQNTLRIPKYRGQNFAC